MVGGHKGGVDREDLKIDLGHAPNMDKPGKEDESQGCAIVLEEDTDPVMEKGAGAENAAEVGEDEDEEGDDDREIEGGLVAEARENFDALLEIDEGDVEAEDVAREASDPAKPVARICDGENPVKDEGPSGAIRSLS